MVRWSLWSLSGHDRHQRLRLLFILVVTISHDFAKYNFLIRFWWYWVSSRRWAVIGRFISWGSLLHFEHFLDIPFFRFEDLRRWWGYNGLFLLSFLFLLWFILVLMGLFILLRNRAIIVFRLFTKVVRVFFTFRDFSRYIVHLENLTCLLLSIKVWGENDPNLGSATAPLLNTFALGHGHASHLCLWLRKDLRWVSFIVNTVIVMYNKYLLSCTFLYLKVVFWARLVAWEQACWLCGWRHSNLFINGTLTIVYGCWRCAQLICLSLWHLLLSFALLLPFLVFNL